MPPPAIAPEQEATLQAMMADLHAVWENWASQVPGDVVLMVFAGFAVHAARQADPPIPLDGFLGGIARQWDQAENLARLERP